MASQSANARRPATATRVLLLSGWLAGAESASWALLQPVVARLDDTPQIRMQQGMLRTFGRVMPILLPLTSVLIVVTAVVAPAGAPRVLWGVAAAVLIGFTLTVNVPINKRTLTWDAEHPPEGWRADRHRWHAYQGVRAVLACSLVYVIDPTGGAGWSCPTQRFASP